MRKAFDAQFIGRHNVLYERFSQHYQVLEDTVKSFRRVVQSCSGHFQRICKRNHHCRPKRGSTGLLLSAWTHTDLGKNQKQLQDEKRSRKIWRVGCAEEEKANRLTQPSVSEKDQPDTPKKNPNPTPGTKKETIEHSLNISLNSCPVFSCTEQGFRRSKESRASVWQART